MTINRRQVLMIPGSVLAVVLVPGCGAFFGLFLSRILVRGLRRGGRAGGRRSLTSLGRAISIGARAVRIARLRSDFEYIESDKLEVYDIERRHIADVIDEKDGYYVLDDEDNKLMYSQKENNHLLHRDLFGNYIGRSVFTDENKNIHYDQNDNYRGYDLLKTKEMASYHYNEKDRLIGKSNMRKRNNGYYVEADKALTETIEALADNKVLTCDNAKSAWDQYLTAKSDCEEFGRDCEEVTYTLSRLNRALKSCE